MEQKLGMTSGRKIGDQMDHLESLCTVFVKSFDMLPQSEKGCLLLNMLKGIRRLKKSVDEADMEQRKTLLLKADFDARKIKGRLASVLCMLDAHIRKPTKEEECIDIEELLDADNSENLLTLEELGGDYNDMRSYILTNFDSIYTKTKDTANRTDIVLASLSQFQDDLKDSCEKRQELWVMMKSDYLMQQWDEQKATIIYRIKLDLDDEKNCKLTKTEILERALKQLKTDHITNIYKRELKELNKTVLNDWQSPVDVLMKYRNKLEEEDIADFLCFFYSYDYITEALQALLLREPSDYDMLFCNKAAQEYVETLIPVLKTFGGINDKGHYGILKLVLQDLGLAEQELDNGYQMMLFVNEKMIKREDEKLSRQDSITKVTGKLNGRQFAKLETEGLKRTKIKDKNEYARMRAIYWRCFTILNHYRIVDVEKLGYDEYLNTPHPFMEKFDPWVELDPDDKERLNFLSFVLRGEIDPF